MNLSKYKYLIRLVCTRPITTYLFNKYAKGNEILLKDILNNVLVKRGNKEASIQKHFSHLLIHNPEFSYMFFWRINNGSFFWKWLFYKDYSCKLFKNTIIGGGVLCYHPFATVINANKIGENFVFRNSITIGNKNNEIHKIPTIGNNVDVGANAVIIGDIEIGDNVVIGAGAVVVKSVPSNSIVVGNPARILESNKYEH